MTPFDLEKAKKGMPMKTRRGRAAKFIALLQGGQPAPLVVDVTINSIQKATSVENYYLDGRHGTVHDSDLDLFMSDDFS